jgi:hypothetical protein
MTVAPSLFTRWLSQGSEEWIVLTAQTSVADAFAANTGPDASRLPW